MTETEDIRLSKVKQEVAEDFKFDSWKDLEAYFKDGELGLLVEALNEVAKKMAIRCHNLEMAYEPWAKITSYVQENPPASLRVGDHISEYVMQLVAGATTAYNQGYRDASKKAIEIITKGL